MTIKFRDRLSGLSFSGNPTSNDLTNIQRAADESFRYIANLPWNQGRIIGPVTVTNVATDIPHGLDRAWQGWILVDLDTARTVYRNGASSDETKFIRLRASGNCNVKLWVF